jgi:hypothetical protein
MQVKMYDFCMYCVDVGKIASSIVRAIYCASCVGVGYFKVYLWDVYVGARLFSYMGMVF